MVNMKVVALFFSFLTNIYASQSDNQSSSYDRCIEKLSCRILHNLVAAPGAGRLAPGAMNSV
ncbi:hypothetical protein A2U01_0114152, partial [Trifolium medium]|nr:hypothetical protein [Trifolium medium]